MNADRPIPPLTPEEMTAQQVGLIDEWQADRGQPNPPGALWWFLARSPDGMRAVGKLGAFARMHSGLPEDLRVVAVLSVVTQRGYAFEVGLQRANLERLGMPAEQIEAIQMRRFDALPAPVADVARFAYAVADKGRAPADRIAAVRAHLDDEQTVALGIVVGYFGMIADVAATFGY